MREGVEGRLLTTLWSIQIQILLVLRFNTALHNIVPQYCFYNTDNNLVQLNTPDTLPLYKNVVLYTYTVNTMLFFINFIILSKNTPIVLIILWCVSRCANTVLASKYYGTISKYTNSMFHEFEQVCRAPKVMIPDLPEE